MKTSLVVLSLLISNNVLAETVHCHGDSLLQNDRNYQWVHVQDADIEVTVDLDRAEATYRGLKFTRRTGYSISHRFSPANDGEVIQLYPTTSGDVSFAIFLNTKVLNLDVDTDKFLLVVSDMGSQGIVPLSCR